MGCGRVQKAHASVAEHLQGRLVNFCKLSGKADVDVQKRAADHLVSGGSLVKYSLPLSASPDPATKPKSIPIQAYIGLKICERAAEPTSGRSCVNFAPALLAISRR